MEDILDVKMPPAPPKPNITFEEKEPEPEQEPEQEEEEEEEEEELAPIKQEFIPDNEVFTPPKIQKVKRKCSEKQLAHLEKIRKKALEKRAEQKAFQDEQKLKQRKYLDAEKKKKEARKHKKRAPKPEPVYESRESDETEEEEEEYEEYEPEPEPKTRPRRKKTIDNLVQKPTEIYHKLTAAEIRAIQKDAINDYDIIRKERKHHKETEKAQYMEELRQKEAIRKIAQPDNDPWATAFTFG
jgi:hypothetical protein